MGVVGVRSAAGGSEGSGWSMKAAAFGGSDELHPTPSNSVPSISPLPAG